MRLINDIKIRFEGEVITERILEKIRQEGHRIKRFVPILFHSKYNDKDLLLSLLYKYTPFVILSDISKGKLVFKATLKRFWQDPDDDDSLVVFGLRLVPMSGSVEDVKRDTYERTAINTFERSGGKIKSETGDGALLFECFFHEPGYELHEIRPPDTFQRVQTAAD